MVEAEPGWQRSSFCADGNCVEVSQKGQFILFRDGKDPDGTVLAFTPQVWKKFLDRISAGHLTNDN